MSERVFAIRGTAWAIAFSKCDQLVVFQIFRLLPGVYFMLRSAEHWRPEAPTWRFFVTTHHLTYGLGVFYSNQEQQWTKPMGQTEQIGPTKAIPSQRTYKPNDKPYNIESSSETDPQTEHLADHKPSSTHEPTTARRNQKNNTALSMAKPANAI